jgi:hypothetical protein
MNVTANVYITGRLMTVAVNMLHSVRARIINKRLVYTSFEPLNCGTQIGSVLKMRKAPVTDASHSECSILAYQTTQRVHVKVKPPLLKSHVMKAADPSGRAV